ncbi:hypothetical protein CDA63_02345 [Hymenobacter amundsenii]|uniref:Uncharacterized protein n=1 Tax=Hymenobacter amundsenii TaxID=2006685 RepID=A0A246FPK4_9BACT|nr:hypothetical protein CDA63_02345 [Hymenobacter amundsenii]
MTFALLLTGLSAGAAQAQNRAPVTSTRHQPTERISPVPGVVLPTGVGQAAAEPLAVPIVEPNARLAMPYMPSGQVTVDSVQVEPAVPATRPLRKRGRSNRQ